MGLGSGEGGGWVGRGHRRQKEGGEGGRSKGNVKRLQGVTVGGEGRGGGAEGRKVHSRSAEIKSSSSTRGLKLTSHPQLEFRINRKYMFHHTPHRMSMQTP